MANLARVRVLWTGPAVVGDGVTTLFFDEAHSGFLADVRSFFFDLRFAFPNTLQLTFPPSGDLIDVATGELSGTWTEADPGAITAAGAGGHVSGVGARVTWATSGIRSGRRVRGSTFLCPLTESMFDTDGTPDAAFVTLVQTAGTALVTASGTNMKVYSRASAGRSGQSNTVIAAGAPDKVSWLRSRRT